MDFAAVESSVLSAAYSIWGQTVTYTPGNQAIAAFECTAIVGPEKDGSDTDWRRKIREFNVQGSDLTDQGLTEPTDNRTGSSGDTVTIVGPNGDEVWQISSYPQPLYQGGEWVCILEKELTPTGRIA